ncbi:MAG: hypothetical protein COB83_08375 [Gammaproteobacteria bacterium]|nr:MAG: hypothetical protein COB83_08375 [Gammaproteobacteria bacterium]
MTKFKTTLIALTTAIPVLAFSLPSQAMDATLERALVKMCKAAASDTRIRLKNSIDDYRLTYRKVALNVMCNGDDIISFAENHGAYKTAAKLQHSIGNVSIIDTVATTKLSVTFTE